MGIIAGAMDSENNLQRTKFLKADGQTLHETVRDARIKQIIYTVVLFSVLAVILGLVVKYSVDFARDFNSSGETTPSSISTTKTEFKTTLTNETWSTSSQASVNRTVSLLTIMLQTSEYTTTETLTNYTKKSETSGISHTASTTGLGLETSVVTSGTELETNATSTPTSTHSETSVSSIGESSPSTTLATSATTDQIKSSVASSTSTGFDRYTTAETTVQSGTSAGVYTTSQLETPETSATIPTTQQMSESIPVTTKPELHSTSLTTEESEASTITALTTQEEKFTTQKVKSTDATDSSTLSHTPETSATDGSVTVPVTTPSSEGTSDVTARESQSTTELVSTQYEITTPSHKNTSYVTTTETQPITEHITTDVTTREATSTHRITFTTTIGESMGGVITSEPQSTTEVISTQYGITTPSVENTSYVATTEAQSITEHITTDVTTREVMSTLHRTFTTTSGESTGVVITSEPQPTTKVISTQYEITTPSGENTSYVTTTEAQPKTEPVTTDVTTREVVSTHHRTFTTTSRERTGGVITSEPQPTTEVINTHGVTESTISHYITREPLTTDKEISTHNVTTITVETTETEVPSESVSEEVTTSKATTEKPEDAWPFTFGPNIDLGEHLTSAGFRKGQASDNHTCDHVREVPEYLRSDEEMYKGIAPFYQKYTEAYGIPVLGSINVTEEGLRRACYVVRFMLASRYDIRNTMYKFYIRVALIGDDEQTTSLWEYRDFDSDYWDKRSRGLGATVHIPLASAGDDNSRCKYKDRYPNNEILVHEFAHGVHQFGATFTIPRFEVRLKALYDKAINESRYQNSYMGTNRNEYWAVGNEIFLESFEGNGYVYNINGTDVALRDRHTLALYDPGLVELLEEVYSCPNRLRSRCQFKRSPDCSLSNFHFLYGEKFRVIVSCPTDKTYKNFTSVDECVAKACHRQKEVFGYNSIGKCVTYNCPDPSNFGFKVGGVGYDIYRLEVPFPEPAYKVSEEDIQQLCTRPYNLSGRCEVAEEERVLCGPDVQTSSQCEARGCCYQNNTCFYSITSKCTNRFYDCPERAADSGQCESKKFMRNKCPMSCDLGVCQRSES